MSLFFKYIFSLIIISFVGVSPSFAEEVSGSDAAASFGAYDVVDYGMNANCRAFIDANGNPGPWGEEMLRAFGILGESCFYERADFTAICPRFRSFSRTVKTRFLLFFFAAMAHEEATCNTEAVKENATNDTARGLFQLEDSNVQREEASRHSLCMPGIPVPTSVMNGIRFQAECGAATLYTNACDNSHSPQSTLCRVGNCGYWQGLKRTSGVIATRAARFPGCN